MNNRRVLEQSKLQSRHIVFARHETFHPRFGWLKKGFDQAAKDPAIFLQDDATVRGNVLDVLLRLRESAGIEK